MPTPSVQTTPPFPACRGRTPPVVRDGPNLDHDAGYVFSRWHVVFPQRLTDGVQPLHLTRAGSTVESVDSTPLNAFNTGTGFYGQVAKGGASGAPPCATPLLHRHGQAPAARQPGTRYRAMFPDANTRGVNLSASRSDKASAAAGLFAVTDSPSDATRGVASLLACIGLLTLASPDASGAHPGA